MALITGSVNLTGSIAPFDTTDVYPTHSSIYGKGGYREVQTFIDRDNIPQLRRVIGMLVYVDEDKNIYQLVDGIENSNWQIIKIKLSQIENIESLNDPSQLQKITQGLNTGYRLFGKPTENYGQVGENAIDLSHSFDPNGMNGASGAFSFVIGEGTKTTQSHSFVSGKYNKNIQNTIVEIGIGTNDLNRVNAFEIYKDGLILAPALTNEKIKSNPHSFVTKKYMDEIIENLVIDCGLFG